MENLKRREYENGKYVLRADQVDGMVMFSLIDTDTMIYEDLLDGKPLSCKVGPHRLESEFGHWDRKILRCLEIGANPLM